jgi:hypothetical protein
VGAATCSTNRSRLPGRSTLRTAGKDPGRVLDSAQYEGTDDLVAQSVVQRQCLRTLCVHGQLDAGRFGTPAQARVHPKVWFDGWLTPPRALGDDPEFSRAYPDSPRQAAEGQTNVPGDNNPML